MKKTRLLAMLGLVAALSGCFDLLQEFWFTSTGGARMRVDVSLPRALIAMAGPGARERMREDAKATEAELRKDPAVKQFTFTEKEEGSVLHFVYDLEVDDATKLASLYQRGFDRPDEKRDAARMNFRIERTAVGLRYVQQVGPDEVPDAGAPLDEPGAELGRGLGEAMGNALGEAMLGGHYITTRLHAPSFGQTNGTLNAEKDTVEWKIPLSEAMTVRRELTAEMPIGPARWFWIGGVGVAAILLVTTVSRMRKRPVR